MTSEELNQKIDKAYDIFQTERCFNPTIKIERQAFTNVVDKLLRELLQIEFNEVVQQINELPDYEHPFASMFDKYMKNSSVNVDQAIFIWNAAIDSVQTHYRDLKVDLHNSAEKFFPKL